MKNKTCGKCKIAKPSGRQGWMYCPRKHDTVLSEAKQCKTPYITNRDKLRQMSDEELATAWSEEVFVFAWCSDCLRYCREPYSPEAKEKCKKQMLSWLKKEAKDE